MQQTLAPAGPMTLDEWYALDDAHRDLVDGRLAEDEMPSVLHEMIVGWLVYTLTQWGLPLGAIVAPAGGKFVVGPSRGRMPDAFAYLPGTKPPPREGLVRVPPTIVIEVVSPSSRDEHRDRVEKLADYAAFGVRFYWLVDPVARSLEILELDATRAYESKLVAHAGVVENVPGCAGLVLELDALWKYTERAAVETE